MAVKTNIFPLYEIENGEKYTINMKFKESTPVEEYLKLQGRFNCLTRSMIQDIQDDVNRSWSTLVEKETRLVY